MHELVFLGSFAFRMALVFFRIFWERLARFMSVLVLCFFWFCATDLSSHSITSLGSAYIRWAGLVVSLRRT
jgi:hypothetical protein